MKTPVILITGYLGAGKTTLLRLIISKTQGRRIAILMNEFGSISIDSKVVQGTNITMTELSGGCVCCSLTGEFEAAINEIREKINPECIVIETTGVAEPDAIVGSLQGIENVRLDCIVVVVDAESMIKFPSIGHTGRAQIEMADIILLNKIDLIDNRSEDVRAKLMEINPRAMMVKTVMCKVPIDFIMTTKEDHKTSSTSSHIDDENIQQFSYSSRKKFSLESIMKVFENLPNEIIRAKGFVVTEEGSFLINYVFGRFDYEDFASEETALVFIGNGAEKYMDEVTTKLKECEI